MAVKSQFPLKYVAGPDIEPGTSNSSDTLPTFTRPGHAEEKHGYQ